MNLLDMRLKTYSLILLIFSSSFLLAQSGDLAKIFFKTSEFNFGDIQQGDVIKYDFEFQNTGLQPLIINNVLTTCGCTVGEYPKEPIPPGEKGVIKASFNSHGKMGVQNKVITIMSNAQVPNAKVFLKGNVLPSTEEHK